MVKTSTNDTGGRLGGLLASRQSLAFDWKTSMGPRVDRPALPMEPRQLEINRRVIRPKRK